MLTGDQFHYLVHVRRVSEGDEFTALDAQRRVRLKVLRVAAGSLLLELVAEEGLDRPRERMILLPFLLKGGKLDDVVRQACEAGVAAVIPVEGEHCVSRLTQERDTRKKVARWQAIAREAAQQCGSDFVAEVHFPIRTEELKEVWDAAHPLVFFHEKPLAKASLHGYLSHTPTTVGLMVGPEGGFSDKEVRFFLEQKFLPCWLGKTVLRAETASVYALAAVRTILQERTDWTILT